MSKVLHTIAFDNKQNQNSTYSGALINLIKTSTVLIKNLQNKGRLSDVDMQNGYKLAEKVLRDGNTVSNPKLLEFKKTISELNDRYSRVCSSSLMLDDSNEDVSKFKNYAGDLIKHLTSLFSDNVKSTRPILQMQDDSIPVLTVMLIASIQSIDVFNRCMESQQATAAKLSSDIKSLSNILGGLIMYLTSFYNEIRAELKAIPDSDKEGQKYKNIENIEYNSDAMLYAINNLPIKNSSEYKFIISNGQVVLAIPPSILPPELLTGVNIPDDYLKEFENQGIDPNSISVFYSDIMGNIISKISMIAYQIDTNQQATGAFDPINPALKDSTKIANLNEVSSNILKIGNDNVNSITSKTSSEQNSIDSILRIWETLVQLYNKLFLN